jgi:arsenite methyltransferase
VAGALHQDEYRSKLAKAGFEKMDVEPTRIYQEQDVSDLLSGTDLDAESVIAQVDGKFASAFVRAQKPAGQP